MMDGWEQASCIFLNIIWNGFFLPYIIVEDEIYHTYQGGGGGFRKIITEQMVGWVVANKEEM